MLCVACLVVLIACVTCLVGWLVLLCAALCFVLFVCIVCLLVCAWFGVFCVGVSCFVFVACFRCSLGWLAVFVCFVSMCAGVLMCMCVVRACLFV